MLIYYNFVSFKYLFKQGILTVLAMYGGFIEKILAEIKTINILLTQPNTFCI